jgi:hypothetical protein
LGVNESDKSGALYAANQMVKKAVTKSGRNKAGFIRTTLAPVNDDHETRFGLVDVLLIVALIGGTVAMARWLLAH